MAYCVKCGVELTASEKVCPLCLTPVMLPEESPKDAEKPYPSRIETVNAHIDAKYGAELAMLFLLIPMLAVLACDLAISLRVTWSAYVLGAGVCVCCWAILPFYLGIKKPYLYIVMDCLSTAAYLALIAYKTHGMRWYGPVALPLTLLAGLVCVAIVYAARRKKMPVLIRFANMVLIVGAALIGTEIVLDLFTQGQIRLTWSIYALVPLAVFAAGFHVIERSAYLKTIIKRRLFL